MTKVEESKRSLRSKELYKAEIKVLKIIPAVLAFITFLNFTLSYIGIDIMALSFIGGVSILPLAFLYLSSYVFQFCNYHRLFLHYVTFNWVLNTFDFSIGIPVSDEVLFILYNVITLIFAIIFIYEQRFNEAVCKVVA